MSPLSLVVYLYLLLVESNVHTITRKSLPDVCLNTGGDTNTSSSMDPHANGKNVVAIAGIAGHFITFSNGRCPIVATFHTLKPYSGFETSPKNVITNFIPAAFLQRCCLAEKTWGPFQNICNLTDHLWYLMAILTDHFICYDIHHICWYGIGSDFWNGVWFVWQMNK